MTHSRVFYIKQRANSLTFDWSIALKLLPSSARIFRSSQTQPLSSFVPLAMCKKLSWQGFTNSRSLLHLSFLCLALRQRQRWIANVFYLWGANFWYRGGQSGIHSHSLTFLSRTTEQAKLRNATTTICKERNRMNGKTTFWINEHRLTFWASTFWDHIHLNFGSEDSSLA